MTFLRLLRENLAYHWRGNLAVFLGVALGTAVLTGALFVGDSLRGSLRALTLDQLGWVEAALLPGRFFRNDLVEKLPAEPRAGVLMLQGSARSHNDGATVAPRVNLFGADEAFWPALSGSQPEFWRSDAAQAVVNAALAKALNVKPGDTISFSVQKSDSIPRETLLGKRRRDDVLQTIDVKVQGIADDRMARFTLRPTPEPALNAFVPLAFLQEQLALAGKVNAALLGASTHGGVAWPKVLEENLTLADWGLMLTSPADRARAFVKLLDPRNDDGVLKRPRWQGRVPEPLAKMANPDGTLSVEQVVAFYKKHRAYALLQSGQMLLEPAVEDAARRAWDVVQASDGKAEPLHESLIYLADSISDGKNEWPYAVIAAVPPRDVPQGPNPKLQLEDDEIVLVDWPKPGFNLQPGDPVTVTYYLPDDHNRLELKTVKLLLAGRIPLEGAADDPDWTPPFPGITDKLAIAAWETPPFPYNAKRVHKSDEEYWQRYRTTPKAYVTLATGQKLWPSRFGKITSIRVPANATAAFQTALLKRLTPERGGFVLRNVREQALGATGGSTDFGVLFLAFSFFLIAAALLLVGLLVRLNIDRRAGEIGLLMATGWSHGKVRGLLLAEGAMLAVLGALVGLLGALGYAAAMLRLLAAQWPEGTDLAFLRLHTTPASFAIGYGASVIVSLLTLAWATRVLSKLAPRSLLAGETSSAAGERHAGTRSRWVLLGALVGAAGCLVAGVFATGHEAKAGSFFGAGALLLAAALTFVWRRLVGHGVVGHVSNVPSSSAGHVANVPHSVWQLGTRNAGRNPVRSVLTVGLLASATFLIVAVESFHKETGAEFLDRHGGSGGFALIAETNVPIFQDLNDPRTRFDWDLPEDKLKQFDDVRFVGCRLKTGDDASCLNLYQPLEPRVLGVPEALIREGRFDFGATLAETDAEKTNPWLLLEKTLDDGAVPAIVDANTAQWILKVKLGATLTMTDDRGQPAKLRVVALLKESIFQSELLIAETSFLELFPRREGFQFFLIETPSRGPLTLPSPPRGEGRVRGMNEVNPAGPAGIQKDLQLALADQGAEVTTTVRRLNSYLAVENTYLDTFKALGGLGLLLGAAGLAIVLLRGVWERRGELALLRALGFQPRQLAWLVLAENVMLLALGLTAGSVAALLAVAPHLVGSGASVLWGRLALLLLLVSAVGMVSGLFAVRGSLRTPLLTALRRE
jgi:putative ABC transport system permease protein